MRIGVHQPNYLPWPGYFYKISQCDTFVILDSATCPDRGYVNRVKVMTPSGEQWLTQSIPIKDRYKNLICDIEFSDERWRVKHVNLLQGYYSGAPCFKKFFPDISAIIKDKSIRKLVDMNYRLISHFMDLLGLSPNVIFASELGLSDAKATDMLIEIMKKIGGDTYISGMGGATYQDEDQFAENGIEVVYTNFEQPAYPQFKTPEFVPGLSIIDLVFNCGDESRNYLRSLNPIGANCMEKKGV